MWARDLIYPITVNRTDFNLNLTSPSTLTSIEYVAFPHLPSQRWRPTQTLYRRSSVRAMSLTATAVLAGCPRAS
jgi:hypothetical protein